MSELCHYGIKGMKWGVRRYQNEDGTLTIQGRMRYGTKQEKEAARKEYKKILDKTERKVNNSLTPKEVFKYTDGTWRKAAKYMVDNNISLEEAKKKAKRVSYRNAVMVTIASAASFIITPEMVAQASREFSTGFKNGYTRAKTAKAAAKAAEKVNEYGQPIFEYTHGKWRKS